MDHPPGAEVEVRFRTAAEGGRSSGVSLGSGTYRPHFVVPGGEYLGVEFAQSSSEMVWPGDRATATVAFVYESNVDYAPLVEGASFDVMEGPRVVATGRVIRLVREVRRGTQNAL